RCRVNLLDNDSAAALTINKPVPIPIEWPACRRGLVGVTVGPHCSERAKPLTLPIRQIHQRAQRDTYIDLIGSDGLDRLDDRQLAARRSAAHRVGQSAN